MKVSTRLFARVIAIAFIAFISLFSLDVFGGDQSFWESLLGFLIHLIPTFVLIGILILAWKKEIIGGYIFLGIGVFFIFAFDTYEHILPFLLISMPVIVVGILFLISGYGRK